MTLAWQDYETEERQAHLARSQPLRWFVWPTWITGGLLAIAWARILYLAACEVATWFVAKIPQ